MTENMQSEGNDCRAAEEALKLLAEKSCKPRRVFLAGPMRGYKRWNFGAFEHATKLLREHLYEVISPHEYDLAEGFDPDGSSEQVTPTMLKLWMLRNTWLLAECDAIVMLNGWSNSDGARAEYYLAKSMGKEIIHQSDLSDLAFLV